MALLEVAVAVAGEEEEEREEAGMQARVAAA